MVPSKGKTRIKESNSPKSKIFSTDLPPWGLWLWMSRHWRPLILTCKVLLLKTFWIMSKKRVLMSLIHQRARLLSLKSLNTSYISPWSSYSIFMCSTLFLFTQATLCTTNQTVIKNSRLNTAARTSTQIFPYNCCTLRWLSIYGFLQDKLQMVSPSLEPLPLC
jgi:hypothetical protein